MRSGARAIQTSRQTLSAKPPNDPTAPTGFSRAYGRPRRGIGRRLATSPDALNTSKKRTGEVIHPLAGSGTQGTQMHSEVISYGEGTQLKPSPAPVCRHREFLPLEVLMVVRGLAGPTVSRRRRLVFKQRKEDA
jgi:hypothetical protein